MVARHGALPTARPHLGHPGISQDLERRTLLPPTWRLNAVTHTAGRRSAPFTPALAARTSPRLVLVAGLLVLATGMALLALLPTSYPYVAGAFAVVGPGTTGPGLGSALIMGAANDDQAGSAAAIEELAYELGSVLGITFIGSLVGAIYRAGLPAAVDDATRESMAGPSAPCGSPMRPAPSSRRSPLSESWEGCSRPWLPTRCGRSFLVRCGSTRHSTSVIQAGDVSRHPRDRRNDRIFWSKASGV
jgi:hypothetical protein